MYTLVQDDDSHWFVIPADKFTHWYEWLETLDWNVPDYAVPVNGPASSVLFNEYII